MNKTEFIGNLGRDPEMRYTPSGQAVTSFSVAVAENYTDKTGEKVKNTIWYRCQAWGKQAEICNEYLKKGSKVFISGKLSFDKATGSPIMWEKKDGSKGVSFDINVREVEFLSPRQDGKEAAQPENNAPQDDSIPF